MIEQMDDADETRRESPGPLHREIPDLDRGSVVGRYIILDVVGQGGMGVVYAAYDPELERKVAIKLLQAKTGSVGSSAGGQAWLQREAQAQAKLAHPNVLSVYDVGTLADDRVFVAMELVEGETLRAWLDRADRSWQHVLDVVAAAGAGLAAAHRAGLVHRDFKPENVLVGSDGRARVMDFGLAHERDAEMPPGSDSGNVIGTPAYIAPELYAAKPATAASDQFALGVTLYTALFGGKPYAKEAFQLPRAPGVEPKSPPASSRVPARIQRAVMRAVAIDPAARWPSVDALLGELAIEGSSTRRRVIAGSITFGLAGALVATLAFGHHADDVGCSARSLDGIWDVPIRLAVHTGFLGVKAPYAESSFHAVAGALDKYTSEWTEASIESCRATRLRGEQSEATQTLRQACLDARLEQVRDLAQLLESPSRAVLDKADAAVQALDPVRSCADVRILTDAAPTDPIAIRDYNAQELKLALARAQLAAGLLVASLGTAQGVLSKAHELHVDGLAADAQLVRGTVLMAAGNIDQALAALQDSTWTGIAQRARRCGLDGRPTVEAGCSAGVDRSVDRDECALGVLPRAASHRTARGAGRDLGIARRARSRDQDARRGDRRGTARIRCRQHVAVATRRNARDDDGPRRRVGRRDSAPRARARDARANGRPRSSRCRVAAVELGCLLRSRRRLEASPRRLRARARDSRTHVRTVEPVSRRDAQQPRRLQTQVGRSRRRGCRHRACESDRDTRTRYDESAVSRRRNDRS
jgi:hypothetical protein